MHLPKLIKKLIAFPKIFPRAAHPRQLALCMLFMIFTGAGSRGGLLWADQTWPSDLSATGGQITVTSEKITLGADIYIRELTLLVKGTVTIDLNGKSLTIGTLYLGGERTGPDSSLTFDSTNGSGTVTVTTYDVANDANTALTVKSGVTLTLNRNYYLNTNDNKKTILTIYGNLILGENATPYEDGGVTYNLEDSIDPATPIEVTYETNNYYWQGSSDTDWTNSQNWTADSAGTKKVKPGTYPGCKDDESAHFESDYANDITHFSLTGTNLSIINNASISFASDISAATITNIGSLTASDITASTITNSGSLTSDTINASTSLENSGSLTVGTITACPSLTNNGGTITATSITAGSVFSNSTIKTQNLTVVNNIKFGNDSTKAGTLEFTGSGSLNVTSGTANSFFNDILIDNGATLTLASDIAVYGNWTNNNTNDGLSAGSHKVTLAGDGKTVSGNQTFADVDFTGANNTVSGDNTFDDVSFSANTSLSGTNKFANFTTNGTTVTFGSSTTQTVNGSFTITGSTLTSSGNWTITTPTSTANVTNSTIKNSNSTNAFISATSCTDDGGNINWDFVGQDYNWQSNSTSDKTNWNNPANWSPASVPGPSSNVIIPGTLSNFPDISTTSVEITNLNLSTSASKITLSGSSNFVVSGTFTNKGTTVYSSSGRIVNSSGTAINDVSNSGTVSYSGATQTITDYGETDYANLVVSGGTATSSTDIKVTGTFTNSATTSFGGATSITGTVTNNASCTINGTAQITFNGTVTNNGTITNNTGATLFNGSNNVINGNNTFADVTVSGASTFSGNNSFTNFTCTTTGVILTFGANKTQTVTGNFNISGATLTSSGSWTITTPAATATVSNSTIINSSSTNAYIRATSSTDGGNNSNWNFAGNTYTWNGNAASDKTKWNNAGNWTPKSIPGPDSNATIPANLTNYPDISSSPAEITITNLTLNASSSKIKLSSTNNLKVTGSLTNKGSITFSDSGRIVNTSGTAINDVLNGGTVEYSGGTAGSPMEITDYGDTDYAKLLVSGLAAATADISISGDFGNSGTAAFSGATTVGGLVTNNAGATASFGGVTTLRGNVTNNGTVSATAQVTYAAAVTNNGTINATAQVTYADAVVNNGTITNDADTSFEGNYSGSGSLIGSTSADPTITFLGDVTFGTFTANGDTVKLAGNTAQTLTTNGQTLGNISFENTNATVSVSGALISDGVISTIAGAEVSLSGNLQSSGSISNAGSIVLGTSGTMTFASYSGTGTITSAGAGITSNASTAQTLNSVRFTGNCAITNSGSAGLTLTNLTGSADKTATLAGGSSGITITGASWNTCNLSTSGTVTIPSSSSANALGAVTATGGSLTLTASSYVVSLTTNTGASVTTTNPLAITGNLSNAGSLDAQAATISVGGHLTNSATGAISVTTATITVGANWTNSGTFTAGDGTVNFTGANASIAGDNAFHTVNFSGANASLTGSNSFRTANFTANTTLSADNTFTTFNCTTAGVTLTFGDGKRQRIESDGTSQGIFTITGTAAEPVVLTSQTRGTEQSTWWILDMEIPSNASVQYASISSSYAESDISAMVSNSTEEIEGTTDGWFNAGNIFYWAGNLSSDWSDRLNWSLKRTNLAGRPPALPPSLTDGSSTIIHLAPSTAYNLDYSQVPGQIKLNNLIIETDTLIQKDLTANYILLFGGRTELQAALSAAEDLIMLGQNYSSTDQQTGLSNIYTYPGSSTITSLADQNADYTARLFCTAGASLTAKNFYANGITASSSGDWTLKIHSNFNTNQTFAQAFYCDFSDSACKVQSSDAPEDADALKIMAEECNLKEGYTTGWDYEDFIIQQASTCDDNVIKVDFNRAIRNDASTVTNASAEIILTDAQSACSGIFTDQACTSSLPASDSASSFYSTVYLKSPATWNTDASSLSAGSGTDKSGVNRTISPIIKVARNTAAKASFITDLYGKRLRHYNAESGEYLPFTNVQDACGPVLLYVLTGQELHSEYDSSLGEASQPYYDAHNFLEFRYSEALSIESWPAGLTENIPVSDSLGAVQGSMENSGDLILTLAGLCQIQKGQLYTGRQGQANKYVNAFYYPDSTNTSIFRLSIAGLTDGTIADRSGSQHKNWVGYIEAAVQPSGSVTLTDSINTSAIKDLAGNNQVSAKIPVNVDSTENGIYGSWDLTEPSFAPLMLNISDNWEAGEYYEALGNSISGELYIDEIEFHLFDNKPKYTSEESAVWHTERGWIQRGSNDQLYTDFSYAADIIGGARPFDTDQTRRTSGGIRYSPLAAAAKAFKFTPSQTASAIPDTAFPDFLPYHGAKGTLFTGSSETRRAADRHDGLYFGLALPGKSFSFTDSFTLSYDDTIGFITDLAGNRLRSATIKTIDRTPPSYNLTIGPVNQKELLLLLSKHVVSDIEKIRYIDQSGTKVEISESFESLLPYCFEIINIDSSGNASAHASLQPDTSVPAKVSHITSESDGTEITQIILTMTNDITYKDLCDSYIRLVYPEKYGEFSVDPVTGIQNARVTFIQDQLGNFMNMYDAHALSELAVNVISPSYGCTSDSQPAVGWSVHDWNADQQNFGTLPAGHDYDIVASCVDGLEHAILCFSAKPDSSSISTKINSDLNLDYRIWLPSLNGFSFPAFTYTPSSTGSYQTVNASASEGQLIHTIPAQMTADFSSGSQVSFLYAMADSNYNPLTICNIPTYDIATGLYNTASANRIPLFAVRQLDLSNLLNLDLWSFKIKGLTLQRGGVTIFNNVINVSNGESLTLQVDVAEEGVLNIMIMTLDGNVIDYLAHGKTAAGSYTYTWNGRNKAGNPVARGMYFIRVMGKNFDETRKVMVVK